MEYVYLSQWKTDNITDEYRVDDFSSFSGSWKLKKGKSLVDSWSADEKVSVSEDDFGPYNEHQDLIKGFGGLLVSDRLKKILEFEVGDQVELLPVSIVGREAKLYVLNVLNKVDFIDYDNTEHRPDTTDPNKVKKVTDTTLTIKPENVNDVQIFRDSKYNEAIFIEKSLAERLKEAEVIGFEFRDVSDFDRFDILQ